MGRYLLAAFLAALAWTPLAVADGPKCGAGSKCPQSAPCCSAYGQCGVGAYCIAGCDPRYSYSLKSCLPAPVCKTQDFKLTSLDDVVDISKYLGDSSKANWISSGKPVIYNDALLLTMAPDTVGTLLSSVNLVWYGKISATMTTSRGAGVVTAFILMSDSKDEIDYEFIGVDVQNAQTNYYAQGITNYGNEVNVSAPNTDTTTHVYTVDWTPDQITWSVDGNAMRTKKRSDTWNATGNRWDFPQTPARIQLSLWPAGLPSNAQGTIDWAGGQISWNSPYMKNGYYYAMFSDINVQCYDPPAGAQKTGSKSYIYTDTSATNQSIQITDDSVILKSLMATGDDPNIGSPSSGSSSPTETPNSVPGLNGVSTVPGGGSSGSSGSGGSSGFSQGTGGSSGSSGSKSGARSVQERLAGGGSAFAVLIAIVCVCFWL